MKSIIMRVLFILCVFSFTHSYAARTNQFEQFGDAMRFLPLYVMIVSIGIEDYEGALEIALGALSTQGVVEVIKYGFTSAHENGQSISWAKRPCCDVYEGMPSGHSAAAFSAATHVYYRYGWKPAIPVGILALLTAASRVEAKKHTVLQVSVGALIAWGFSSFFTKPYEYGNTLFLPYMENDIRGGTSIGLNIYHRF